MNTPVTPLAIVDGGSSTLSLAPGLTRDYLLHHHLCPKTVNDAGALVIAATANAFLGGGCVFHQFTRVGRLAITQGLSGFGKDLPPYVIGAGVNKVAGLNVVGLKRAGFGPNERAEIKAAFRLLYESRRNVSQALAEARAREWSAPAQAVFDFVPAATKRGICGPRLQHDAE